MASVEELRSGKLKIDYPECSCCKKKLTYVHTDLILEGKPLLCDDCYYIKLGDIVEKYPIWRPRPREGGVDFLE